MARWKADLTTGVVQMAPETAPTTFSTVLNLTAWTLGIKYDVVKAAYIGTLLMTVKDVANEAVILGQSSALGNNLLVIGGMEPYKENRSHELDIITVTNSGTTIAAVTDGSAEFGLVDSAFKQPV